MFQKITQNLILLLLTLCFPFALFADGTDGPKGKITGKVIDAATKAPVDYATIAIYKAGAAAPFNGVTSDPKGNFTLNNIPFGEYKITIDFVGYQRRTVDHIVLSADAPVKALNTVSLNGSGSQQLKDVNVVAKAPMVENHIDKMVYNAQNDLTAQGGVAIDVLKKVPQISVDVDGNVELQGNSNIRFLINGKPSSIFGASLADALQSIPASQIKSIEVITSPGAKYDAEGTGGIINIILKDSKIQGVNGSVNLSAGTRFENGSLNLNARKGNFGVNAFFSGNEQLNTNTLTTNRTISATDQLYQSGNNNFKRHGYQTGLSFMWDLSKHDNITAAFNYNNFGNNSLGITNQDDNRLTNGTWMDLTSIRNSTSKMNAHSADYSVAYKKTFNKENQELDILYNSSYGNNLSQYSYLQQYTNSGKPSTGSSGYNPGKNNETDISIDYTQPLSKGFTLETGGKVTIQTINNNVTTDTLSLDGIFVPDAAQNNIFNYTRHIYAYYLSSSFSLFNNFINGKAGVRYEYTTNHGDNGAKTITIPSYGIFAPSIVLTHQLSETQSLKASFSYRIERPGYSDLNPFVNVSDPYNISTGNPYLMPEKGYHYEFGYNNSFKSGASLFIAAIYRHNTDDLQPLTLHYASYPAANGETYTDVNVTSRSNIGTESFLGGNFYGSVPVTKKLNLRSNVFFGERYSTDPVLNNGQTAKGFGYRGNLNASYEIAKDFLAEGFVNFNSSQVTIQGRRPAFAWYNLAVRKQFWDKKASIGVSASNPFAKYIHQTAYAYGSNFTQYTTRAIPLQSIGITLSYRFGKMDFKDRNKDRGDNGGDNSDNNDNSDQPRPPAQGTGGGGQGGNQATQLHATSQR